MFFLAVGMFKAVLPRRLNLTVPQWLIVVGIGVAGVLLALFVNISAAEATIAEPSPPAPELWLQATATAPAEPAPVEEAVPAPVEEAVPAPVEAVASPEVASNAPGWAASLDQALEPLESFVGLLYIIGDIVLLIIAGTLLVAFWGGRFSQSWKLIAIAAFCLLHRRYVFCLCRQCLTPMWKAVCGRRSGPSQQSSSGSGQVVEYGISVNSRRSVRRRKA